MGQGRKKPLKLTRVKGQKIYVPPQLETVVITVTKGKPSLSIAGGAVDWEGKKARKP